MSIPPNEAIAGTPPEIASAITRAWIGYFVLITIVGIVLNLALGGVYSMLAANMQGNYWLMRIGFFAVGIAINAPISFFAFQWAVRGKVVPAIISWTVAPGDSAQG
jgi:hypothetical protein